MKTARRSQIESNTVAFVCAKEYEQTLQWESQSPQTPGEWLCVLAFFSVVLIICVLM